MAGPGMGGAAGGAAGGGGSRAGGEGDLECLGDVGEGEGHGGVSGSIKRRLPTPGVGSGNRGVDGTSGKAPHVRAGLRAGGYLRDLYLASTAARTSLVMSKRPLLYRTVRWLIR